MKLSLLIILFLLATTALPQKNNYASIKTSYGTIIVKLANETPLHRDNFINLVRQKYFDKTQIHRVVPRFVIQGGDPDSIFTTPSDTNELKSQRLQAEFPPFIISQARCTGHGTR